MRSLGFVPPGLQGILQPLKPWLLRDDVQEIMLNHPGELIVESWGGYEYCKVAKLNAGYLMRMFQMLAKATHQVINAKQPLLSAAVFGQYRFQCVIPPVSLQPIFSMRRLSGRSHHLQQFVAKHAAQQMFVAHESHQGDTLQLIASALATKANMLVSGATSSGKTSFINACLKQVDSDQRLIVIEDVMELRCDHANVVRLQLPASRYNSELRLQHLLQASLRLRPDRIILGEIRGAEALDLIMANNTGHNGSISSIHANSAKDALRRLRQLIELYGHRQCHAGVIDQEVLSAIDLVVHMHDCNGQRSIAEVLPIEILRDV